MLESIADADFQTELARFNVEINVPPRLLGGSVLTELERDVRASLNRAEERSHAAGAYMMLVGILPTVGPEHLDEGSFSANPRYRLLNEAIFAARGEDLELAIDGVERLEAVADTIAPEAACTSVQLHGQVEPEGYAVRWNAAQAIAGVQLALGANSPYLFGRELWRETRIALFEQATDTRPEELKAQGVRPRVWFGERWITSIFDLFEENVRYFPALLPMCDEEDPEEVLAARRRAEARRAAAARRDRLPLEPAGVRRGGRAPAPAGREPRAARRAHRRRHRRQRGLLLRARGGPLPPGAPDLVADVVLGRRGELPRGARDGIDARLYWPGAGEVPATELILRRLLPMAYEGPRRAGHRRRRPRPPAGHHRAALPDGPQRRGLAGRDGPPPARERGLERRDALRAMTLRYRELMHANEPVHAWPLD